MTSTSKFVMAIAASAAAIALAPQTVAAGTVVAASGPSAGTYSVGSQVSDDQRVTLRAGDVITILDGGRTRVFRGPGTFVLSQGATARSSGTTLTGLTSRRGQARIASSRGDVTVPITNPNIWYVDVNAPGTICLSSISRVNLWRADKSDADAYTIAPSDSPDDGVRVSFDADEALARWDSALQMQDGESYTISSEGDGGEVEITIALLEDAPDDPEALAQLFIANGCTVQIGEMVRTAQAGSETEI